MKTISFCSVSSVSISKNYLKNMLKYSAICFFFLFLNCLLWSKNNSLSWMLWVYGRVHILPVRLSRYTESLVHEFHATKPTYQQNAINILQQLLIFTIYEHINASITIGRLAAGHHLCHTSKQRQMHMHNWHAHIYKIYKKLLC